MLLLLIILQSNLIMPSCRLEENGNTECNAKWPIMMDSVCRPLLSGHLSPLRNGRHQDKPFRNLSACVFACALYPSWPPLHELYHEIVTDSVADWESLFSLEQTTTKITLHEWPLYTVRCAHYLTTHNALSLKLLIYDFHEWLWYREHCLHCSRQDVPTKWCTKWRSLSTTICH